MLCAENEKKKLWNKEEMFFWIGCSFFGLITVFQNQKDFMKNFDWFDKTFFFLVGWFKFIG